MGGIIALRLFYFCLQAQQGTNSHTYPLGDQTVLWEGHPWVEEACRVEVVLLVEKIQVDQVVEAPFLEVLTVA